MVAIELDGRRDDVNAETSEQMLGEFHVVEDDLNLLCHRWRLSVQ